MLLVIVAATALLAAWAVSRDLDGARPPDAHDCFAQRSGLVGVLDPEAPNVVDACQAEGPFLVGLQSRLEKRGLDQDLVWRTSDLERDGNEEALEAWREGRLISWVTGEPWPVPENPDWTEDPYNNLTWLTRYHSLGWLSALARGYREGDRELGIEMGRYLLDWIEDNSLEEPPSPRSWFDGSVRRRTETFVAIWDVLLDVLTEQELSVVLESMHLHGSLLHDYLSDDRFTGHNHNLFHAMALYNLAYHLPELDGSRAWQADARARVTSLMTEMVNVEDGVSTEQAASYHYIALWLFATADRHLALFGEGLSGDDRQLLAEMTRFGALLPDPSGVLPAIGDTSFGAPAARHMDRLAELAQEGITTPEAEFVLSRGRAGSRPADAGFFLGEGFAIFRPSYGDVGPWEDDLHVVVDMGPSRRVHGHDDAMNVLLSAYGEQLLIDSGGPYRYGTPARRAFRRAHSHNTVIVNDQKYVSSGVEIERTEDSGSIR